MDYQIAHAKSSRSRCKKCKETITKGELRIGAVRDNGEYLMTSWTHTKCFNLPPKLKKQGETVESFVDTILEDLTDDLILSEIRNQIVEDIEEGSTKGKKGKAEEGKVAQLKAGLAKRRAEQEGDEAHPKKKHRPNNDEEAQLDIFEQYEKSKVDELKDVLRWNRQAVGGTKDLLMVKILDGQMNGRLGQCPLCVQGQLKILDAQSDKASCNGFFDEDTRAHMSCSFECPLKDAPRKRWFTEKPTDEEEKQMDMEAEEAKSGKTSDDGSDPKLQKLLGKADELDWHLSSDASKIEIKQATKALVAICKNADSKLAIPEGKENMGIGRIVVENKSKSAREVMQAVVDRFGFEEAKAAAATKRSAAMSAACANAANAGVMEAIMELSSLYFKEGNSNAGATYRKVANAIKDIPFEITESNAKGLGKGKTKVAGVGKTSADKIYEFVTTGTIEKLEEKRAALG